MAKELKKHVVDCGLTETDIGKMIVVHKSSVAIAIGGTASPKPKKIRGKLYKILGMNGERNEK